MIDYLKLYKKFYYLRFVEETISKKYKDGKMRCPTHLSVGQEGISAIFSQLVKKSTILVLFNETGHNYSYFYLIFDY